MSPVRDQNGVCKQVWHKPLRRQATIQRKVDLDGNIAASMSMRSIKSISTGGGHQSKKNLKQNDKMWIIANNRADAKKVAVDTEQLEEAEKKRLRKSIGNKNPMVLTRKEMEWQLQQQAKKSDEKLERKKQSLADKVPKSPNVKTVE